MNKHYQLTFMGTVQLQIMQKSRLVVHTSNTSTGEAEAEGSQVQGQSVLHNETLPQ
jgi:hypothetical protein